MTRDVTRMAKVRRNNGVKWRARKCPCPVANGKLETAIHVTWLRTVFFAQGIWTAQRHGSHPFVGTAEYFAENLSRSLSIESHITFHFAAWLLVDLVSQQDAAHLQWDNSSRWQLDRAVPMEQIWHPTTKTRPFQIQPRREYSYSCHKRLPR